MAIKEYIYLLGVEDVQASLKRLTDQGEQALSQFRELGAGAEPFAPVAEGSKAAADATQNLTLRSHDLRGALYVLRPVLQAAGIEVGQLGSFARLAGVGIGGIAAAAAGAVVLGLARLEDAAKTTKGELADLFQSKALSEKAFAGIQASALQFNTTVANIVPGVEALKVAWDRFITETRTFKFVAPAGGDIGQIIPPGMIGSIESLQTAYNNFLKLLRAGRLDQTNATKAAQAFFTAMQTGGKLTAEILRTLPVGTINLIAQAMGRGTISTQQFINEVKLAPISMDRLLEALNRFGLQSDEAFRTNAIVTYKDKLGEIINVLSTGFKDITGISFSDFVISELNAIIKGIKDTKAEFESLRSAIEWIEQHTELPGIGKIVTQVREALSGGPGGAFGGSTEEIQRVWGDIGISSADRFKTAFTNALSQAIPDIAKTIQTDFNNVVPAGSAFGGSKSEIDKIWGGIGMSAADHFIKGFKDTWDAAAAAIQNIIKSINPVSAAGAAEFTGGPLLQQQQQAAQTQPIVAPFQEADQQIRTIWQALVEYITTSISSINFSPITQALVQPFTDALPGIRDVLLQVERMIQEIIRQAQEAQRAVQGIGAGRPFQTPGFIEVAGGGLIRGPGTGTSDSILAWLSNREFVQPARAVSYYGVEFMEAIRRLQLPRNFLVPKLADGGMVRSESTRSLTLVLDTQRFALSGKSSVIDALERHATLQGIASIGRPPGWVR